MLSICLYAISCLAYAFPLGGVYFIEGGVEGLGTRLPLAELYRNGTEGLAADAEQAARYQALAAQLGL